MSITSKISEDKPGGPFFNAALTRRALDDLHDHAEAMHRRQQHPDDALHDLARRAAEWERLGAAVDADDVLRTIRQLNPDYQPYADLEHAILQDRIHAAVAAIQAEAAGAGYRDGLADGAIVGREEIADMVRDIVAGELPAAVDALQEGECCG
jgi:hypothetical protein